MSHALITGASRGVGRAVALALAQRGVAIVMMGRVSDASRETERLLHAMGAEHSTVECDLTDRSSVDRGLERLPFPIDLVVHNAGWIERSPLHETRDESWDRQLEINLTAPFRLTRALLPSMLQRKVGRVLFVSSISAVLGSTNQAAYHASKAGLLGLMRCLAEEISDTGLMTMALLPGSIQTRMLKGSGFAPRMTAEEVATTLVYYALDASRAHNGAVVEMYGT